MKAESLHSIYGEYLEKVRRIEPEKLGQKEKVYISFEQSQFLQNKLEIKAKINDKILILIIVLLVVLFIGEILVAVLLPKNLPVLLGSSGGIITSLLVIIKRLQIIWSEKNSIDIIITMIAVLPPGEITKVIQSLYFSKKESKKQKR